MKRLRLLGAIVAVLVLFVVALPWIVSAERFRPVIQAQLQSALGRPVEFGSLSLGLFPVSLRAGALRIPGLATADSIAVRLRLLPLLSGNVEVESLVLTRPVVEYAQSAAGAGDTPQRPEFLHLEIIDGTLLLTSAKGEKSEYSNIDAAIHSSGPSLTGTASWKNNTLPVSLAFAASADGGKWNVSKLDATAGAIVAGFTGVIDANASTVDGALSIKPTPLDSLPLQSNYRPKGMLTAEVKVAGPLRQPALTGTARLANLEVSGGKFQQPLRATTIDLDLTPARISAKPFSLQIGSTLVQAGFQVDGYTGTPAIDASLTTKDAAIPALLAIAQVNDVTASGTASVAVRATGPLDDPDLSGSGSIAGAEFQLQSLQPPLKIDAAQIRFESASASLENAVFHIGNANAEGTVRVKNFRRPQLSVSLKVDRLSSVEMAGWFSPAKGSSPAASPAVTGDIAVGQMRVNDLTLDGLQASITLRDKLLTLDPLSAGVYGGRLTGSATVNLKAEPAVYNLNTHLDKVESAQLLAAATPLRNVVSGPLTADAQLQFAPKAGEDFARSLDGNIQLQLAQGKLLPLNLLGEVGALAKFLKPLNAGAGNTSFLGLTGRFQLKNGSAQTEDLRVDLDRAAALVTGSMNLADQTLDLRMLTTLNKQFSEEVGGSRIGGFLTAAMSSPKGELLMPSMVKGTFAKPVLSPDAVTLGKMKLNQPQGLQEGVRGIVDLFKGKKKEP